MFGELARPRMRRFAAVLSELRTEPLAVPRLVSKPPRGGQGRSSRGQQGWNRAPPAPGSSGAPRSEAAAIPRAGCKPLSPSSLHTTQKPPDALFQVSRSLRAQRRPGEEEDQ